MYLMVRLLRLLLLLGLALPAFSARAADVVYPPGSRLGLVPPTGMVTSSNFFGFEDADTGAAIILASLPAEAFSELDTGMTADALKRQGMTLERREPIALDTGNGRDPHDCPGGGTTQPSSLQNRRCGRLPGGRGHTWTRSSPERCPGSNAGSGTVPYFCGRCSRRTGTSRGPGSLR